MDDISTTPIKRPHYRLGGLSTFIPLNEESPPVSTRGQRLPSLIQSRSSNSLFTLPRRPRSERRGSFHSHHSTEDEEHGPVEEQELLARKWSHLTEIDARRMSLGPEILMTPQMRSMRLIGNSNPRYRWQRYYKTEEELKKMTKPIRKYYERNNFLISQYLYIDRLLDSSLPHNLIQEYNAVGSNGQPHKMNTINEESSSNPPNSTTPTSVTSPAILPLEAKLKRTPKNLYKLPDEATPLLGDNDDVFDDVPEESFPEIKYDEDDNVDSDSPIVTVAIYINLAANIFLLAAKLAVIVMTSSLSVLASLVDAALDFLSTAIVWLTTRIISQQDQYAYPIGRRRLEPVGVLVFSIIMITSFFQVLLSCFNRLLSDDHTVVELGVPAIAIMLSTVVIKGFAGSGVVWSKTRLCKRSPRTP